MSAGKNLTSRPVLHGTKPAAISERTEKHAMGREGTSTRLAEGPARGCQAPHRSGVSRIAVSSDHGTEEA